MSQPPDLALLALMVRLAELGSLGAASRSLGRAQPNASRALASYERALGVRLFERSARGTRPTPEGELVVGWARGVLEAAEQYSAAAESLRTTRRNRLAVAASQTVAEHLVPRWLAKLRESRPELDVALVVENSHEVERLVQAGESALGFTETPSVAPGLRSARVGRDRMLVVVAPSHPWARRRSGITAAELAAEPLIVREVGSGTRSSLEEALMPHGGTTQPRLELASNAAVRVSVAAGAGAAVLSELAVASAVRSGELVAVTVRDLELVRTLRAVWRAPALVDPVAEELVAIAARPPRPR